MPCQCLDQVRQDFSLITPHSPLCFNSAGTRAAKVMDKEWQQRLQQQEQQWALKQKDLEKRWAARLVEAGRQARSHKAAAAEAHQQQVTSLQAQHGNHVRQLQSKAQQMEWQSSNERALLQK